MTAITPAPGARLLALWNRLSPLPGGAWLFSRILGRIVPYSGTIGAQVVHLSPGHARLRLRDRRSVRNHLGSVHALALANIGELASGLATLAGLPPNVRGIVLGLDVEYEKKARGTLTCEARSTPPRIQGRIDHTVTAEVRDEADDVVATVRVRWRLAEMER